MSESEDRSRLMIRTRWPRESGLQSQPTNQFTISRGPSLMDGGPTDGSIYLTFGHVTPPIFGSPEDEEDFRSSPDLHVKVSAELYMTEARAHELFVLLGRTLGIIEVDAGPNEGQRS